VIPFTGTPGLAQLDLLCKFEPVLFFLFMNGLFVSEKKQRNSAAAVCEAFCCMRLSGQECFFRTAGGKGQRMPLLQRGLENSGNHLSRRSTKD
jgi:hypothetical protein